MEYNEGTKNRDGYEFCRRKIKKGVARGEEFSCSATLLAKKECATHILFFYAYHGRRTIKMILWWRKNENN